MAVTAPKRRSSAAPAPAPSRTKAPQRPQRKKAPGEITIHRTKGAAAAPARRAPARKAPARSAPRVRTAPRPGARRSAQPKLALVVGRTAAGVRHLPDSGLIVRMTRGRTWIAVLGVLLAGIVALNVVTLSFAASTGDIDENITALEKDISMTKNRVAAMYAIKRIRYEAAKQGLAMSTLNEPSVIKFEHKDVETAAQRLSGAG
ncbi:MAG TPA: hypothetical protein VFJ57_03775 [Solirubrobacterales bacterium]|nr:hypothetical protein [Solirubrobacterales bacterium]